MNILFTRIKSLCDQHGITIKQLEQECGFGENRLYRWQDQAPSFDKVKRIADFFGVSMDYLCGMSDIQTPASKVLADDDIIAFQRARENTTPANRKAMMDILRAGFKDAFGE